MIWLLILFLVLGLMMGVHVQLCAMSGQGHPARVFVEFLLSMVLIGIAAFLGIVANGLATLTEVIPLFLAYFLIVFVAAIIMTLSTHWIRRTERRFFGDLFSEWQCEGCVKCFVERIHKLIEANNRGGRSDATSNK